MESLVRIRTLPGPVDGHCNTGVLAADGPAQNNLGRST
jgi:hypothetical protein